MAMIPCKECGKEISSEAEVCPHCGVKTNYGTTKAEKTSWNRYGNVGFLMAVIGVCLFLWALFTFASDLSNTWYYDYYGSLSDHEQFVLFMLSLGGGLVGGGIYLLKTASKNLKGTDEKDKS